MRSINFRDADSVPTVAVVPSFRTPGQSVVQVLRHHDGMRHFQPHIYFDALALLSSTQVVSPVVRSPEWSDEPPSEHSLSSCPLQSRHSSSSYHHCTCVLCTCFSHIHHVLHASPPVPSFYNNCYSSHPPIVRHGHVISGPKFCRYYSSPRDQTYVTRFAQS